MRSSCRFVIRSPHVVVFAAAVVTLAMHEPAHAQATPTPTVTAMGTNQPTPTTPIPCDQAVPPQCAGGDCGGGISSCQPDESGHFCRCEPPTPSPPQPTPAVDHFTCYKAGATARSVKFPGIPIPPGITLTDQWGGSLLEVKRARFLCAPTDKNNENPGADLHAEHLKAYQVKRPRRTAPVSRTNIEVVDQFNAAGLFVDAKKQAYLMVPTVKSLTGSPPTPPMFGVDHFECYNVAATRRAPKFVPVPALPLKDQFGTITVDVKKPQFLCNPTDKNGEDPTAPEHVDHLMCYQIEQVDPAPFAKHVGIFVNDQFGPETLDVKKPALLCVPALKNPSPAVTPTPP